MKRKGTEIGMKAEKRKGKRPRININYFCGFLCIN